jgi:hypothetical protein
MKLPSRSTLVTLSLSLLLSGNGTLVWADTPTKADELLPATEKPPIPAPFAIKAAVPNHPRQVMKFGKHFMVMEEAGLMPLDSDIGCGIYRDDTRYLSAWEISLNDHLAMREDFCTPTRRHIKTKPIKWCRSKASLCKEMSSSLMPCEKD